MTVEQYRQYAASKRLAEGQHYVLLRDGSVLRFTITGAGYSRISVSTYPRPTGVNAPQQQWDRYKYERNRAENQTTTIRYDAGANVPQRRRMIARRAWRKL